MKKMLSLVLTSAMALIVTFTLPVQASPPTHSSVQVPVVEYDSTTGTLQFPELSDVKERDPVGYADALAVLKTSPEMISFISQMTSDIDGTLELLAAYSPSAGKAQLIVDVFDGNKVVWDGTDYKLVPDNMPGSPYPGPASRGLPQCAAGWTAAITWTIANAALCAAFSVAGGIPGVACAIAMNLIGLLPDFNDACK